MKDDNTTSKEELEYFSYIYKQSEEFKKAGLFELAKNHIEISLQIMALIKTIADIAKERDDLKKKLEGVSNE